MGLTANSKLAGVEYVGLSGITQECVEGVMRFLQFGDQITRARILSAAGQHCLLLTVNSDNLVAIKAGFASGYSGEGPKKFSYVLQLLEAHGADIEEYDVSESVIERIDASALTQADLDKLDGARPVRPSRRHDYVDEADWNRSRNGRLWQEFPPVIPFAIVDSRLFDLALGFRENPDDKLMTGYRRLEDIVRTRTGLDDHGAGLFSKAFLGPTAKLQWKDLDPGERNGRAQLFTGAYMAHRNPRAHRELESDANNLVSEFLLLNHLYQLENSAVVAGVETDVKRHPVLTPGRHLELTPWFSSTSPTPCPRTLAA